MDRNATNKWTRLYLERLSYYFFKRLSYCNRMYSKVEKIIVADKIRKSYNVFLEYLVHFLI